MGIIRRDYYKKGDHNAISDDSAQKYKRSDMRLTWDGKLVGKDEWYPKHPQLTIRPIPDRPAITNQTRTQDSPTNLLVPSFNPSAPNNVLIEGFIVNLSGDNITESNGSVTGMLNSVNSDYDLTTVVGTGANLKKSISDAMLCYGATGDYASTPDSAAASITGDIDIRIHLSMDNWVPASTEVLVSKFLTAGDQRSFFFQVNTNGTLTFDVSTLGTNASRVPYASSSAPPSVNGEEMWLRVILDTDNGAGGSRATFYTSEDGQIWSQFDTTLVGSTVSIFDSTAEVAIAGVSGLNLNGSVYEAQILNGIDGTLAVDFNAADYANRTSDTEFLSSLEIYTYISDFSSGTDGFTASNGAIAGNITVGGAEDWLRFTLDAVPGQHSAIQTILVVGVVYTFSCDVYIPSGNTAVDGIKLYDGVLVDQLSFTTTTDSIVTITGTFVAQSTQLRWYPTDGGSVTVTGENDIFYVKNIVVTEQAEWTLNGNTFIQNTGHSVVHSIGDVGIESATGKVISGKSTVFCVYKASTVTSGVGQRLFDARSDSGNRRVAFLSSESPAVVNIFQGASLPIAESSTAITILNAEFNGNDLSSGSVSGSGSAVGNAGDEGWDYGTLFTGYDENLSFSGYIAELYIYEKALSAQETTSMTNYLLDKWT